jgi:phospholipid/cholesterol/gamma-HCH transport system substrate-binding protein
MARKNSNFMIGLFVTAGVLIGVAAIVWIGASQYFEEGSFYVTYFDESVQGLQVDSRVNYRGVDIGKVESIGVAPDHKLVEVIMKIDLHGETEQNVVTQLRAAGITGIVFIELDRRNLEGMILLPPSGMKTRYPVIASQYSQSKQMLTSVDRIMNKIEQVDLKEISDQLKQTSRAVETFLSGNQMTAILGKIDSTAGSLDQTSKAVKTFFTGEQMTGILAKIDSTAGSLDQTSKAVETFFTGEQMTGILAKIDSTAGSLDQGLRRIDRILAEGVVEGVLEEARQGLQESRKTIADVRELVAAVSGEVENFKASETADRARRLLEGIDRRTRGMKTDFERTTEDIRHAVEKLDNLLDRLYANPSDLLFSRPSNNDRPQMGEMRK